MLDLVNCSKFIVVSEMSSERNKKSIGGKTKQTNDVVAKRLEGEYWESARKVSGLPPVNGHTGIFAYHADDCLCSMAGWPCFRDGSIWSCCGSTDKNSQCTKTK